MGIETDSTEDTRTMEQLLSDFHPTMGCLVEPPGYIKKDYQYKQINGEVPIGMIVRASAEDVFFVYFSLDRILQQVESLSRREEKVLQIYYGVSFNSFIQAEKLYRKNGSLEEVNTFLTIPNQEKEKLKIEGRLLGQYDKIIAGSGSNFVQR
ncbi:hypothetical protein HOL21_01715 [Candidatus Woesearchaeota archaeon]|nr:hypothetical protein [Candidatus Woesearchaeota archaeon]MBT5396910.1 hypothetical protein [Candidatus Woesearchaeota archaeon]